MKKNLLLTVAVSVIALGSTSVLAAEATGTGKINAKIVAPVSVNETDELDFGTILSPTDSEKKVTIAPAGTRSSDDGGKILVGTNEGKAAKFTITGAENQSVTVSFSDSATLTGDSGGEMVVNNFKSEPSGTFQLDGTSKTLNVGADLTVGTKQTEGEYTGEYTVTVNY